MVLTFFPLICISSIISFIGGYFLGDLEARHEFTYYQLLINRNVNDHNLPSAQ